MKLFSYVLIAVLVLGGGYLAFVRKSEPVAATPTSTWATEAQVHLTNLLSDQLKATGSHDWTAFDADLKKADAHLASAPAGADVNNFRVALAAYHSQQDLRAQMPQ